MYFLKEDGGRVLKNRIYLTCRANYPSLQIVNVKNSQLSRASLWDKFEIKKLNNQLMNFEIKQENDIIWDFGYIIGKENTQKKRDVFV